MKKTMSYVIGWSLAICLLLGAVDAAAAPAPCSNATLKGGYAFLFHAPSGVIHLGRLDADGNGNFTEAFTLNEGGVTTHQTSAGTYTVNSECGGFLADSTATQLVVLNAGNQVATLSGVTFPICCVCCNREIGEMQRISLQNSTTPCSLASLKGTFFSAEQGLQYEPTSFVGVGVARLVAFVADGAGNIAGKLMLDGPPSFSEVYSVNPDCTGSYDRTFAGDTSPSQHADIVISGDGRTVYGVITGNVNYAVYVEAGKVSE